MILVSDGCGIHSRIASMDAFLKRLGIRTVLVLILEGLELIGSVIVGVLTDVYLVILITRVGE